MIAVIYQITGQRGLVLHPPTRIIHHDPPESVYRRVVDTPARETMWDFRFINTWTIYDDKRK